MIELCEIEREKSVSDRPHGSLGKRYRRRDLRTTCWPLVVTEDKLEKEREGKWNTKEETSGERSEERNAVIGDRCDLSARG
jgi:hypothetical protein